MESSCQNTHENRKKRLQGKTSKISKILPFPEPTNPKPNTHMAHTKMGDKKKLPKGVRCIGTAYSKAISVFLMPSFCHNTQNFCILQSIILSQYIMNKAYSCKG